MTEAERFPGRLRELREQAGLTQQELGERVGVTWEAISRWERGTREPSWSNVVALANALGVSCDAFRQEPAAAPEPQRGRPRKAVPPERAPKRPRGRPRKGT
jgi:transcriptional regulator with XRE-family HTH domain